MFSHNDFLSGMVPADGISKVAARRLLERTDIIRPLQTEPAPPLRLSACVLASDHHLWSADYQEAEGYRLLYLRRGSGRLQCSEQAFELSENSLFFFPLTQPYRLTLKEPVWELRSLILSGPAADYYYQLFSGISAQPVVLSAASPLALQWKELHSGLGKLQESPLMLLEKLTLLMHAAISGASSSCAVQPAIPDYLLSIRENFHIDCSRFYTLDELEAYYRVSKYRIAKEFRQAFGISPIAYLNRLRLQKACDLLRTSNLHVNEIAGVVGFENTNHFIQLFRSRYHVTPGIYRKLNREDCT